MCHANRSEPLGKKLGGRSERERQTDKRSDRTIRRWAGVEEDFDGLSWSDRWIERERERDSDGEVYAETEYIIII